MNKYIAEAIDNEWLGLGDTSKIEVVNTLVKKTADDVEKPHMHLLRFIRDPKNFAFTCKHILNITLHPMQLAIMRELWIRPFPMLIGNRGFGKTFLLGLYAVLRALLCQGSNIVVVGAGFRQSKMIFEYCEKLWRNAPIFRDIVGDTHKNGPKHEADLYSFRIGESIINAIPIGDGSKIRGLRANIIIADEFASIPIQVYETVLEGFAAVSFSPIDRVKAAARKRAMIRMGLMRGIQEKPPSVPGLNSNQVIVSGTAYYGFNHFYDYWVRYKKIVESQGDIEKLQEALGGEVSEKFNYRDYSVIRMPYELLPEDYMDENIVEKSRATHHISSFRMEFSACFSVDTNGFFRRYLIESCVAGNPENPIVLPSCGTASFSAVMRGSLQKRYVMGVDPASEKDNFSIVILEIWPEHRRIVHCWTTTRIRFKKKVKQGIVQEDDFYGYVARKIRDLHKLFPCERIVMDGMGGGVGVEEALRSVKNMFEGEMPILQIVDHDNPKDTDTVPGQHILEIVNFAKADWVAAANHGLKKDFEDKTVLFPIIDSVELAKASAEDVGTGRKVVTVEEEKNLYDTLEDCVYEIEELKDELAVIVHSQVGPTLRDRWDVPEVKQAGGKKGRLRKDRYSALLMANATARQMQAAPTAPRYAVMGGFAHELRRSKQRGEDPALFHQNPEWYDQYTRFSNSYGAVVHHNN